MNHHLPISRRTRRGLFVLTLLFSLGLEAQTRTASAREQENQEFLMRLGFKDYSQAADQTLKSGADLHPLQKRVLEFNRERYEIVNAARNLGAFLISQIQDASPMEKDRLLERLVELTSRTMVLQPLAVPDEFPAELEGIRLDAERNEAKRKWLDTAIRDLLDRSQRELISDMMTTLYGEAGVQQKIKDKDAAFEANLKYVEAEVRNYVRIMYSDPEVAQTKYLGKAMAAVVVRFARASGNSSLEQKLEKAALEKGAILGNFISDQITMIDEKHEPKTIKISQGDFLMEYSSGKTAWSISSAVVPTGIKSRVKAFLSSLYGNLILAPFIADEATLLRKIERNQKKTLREHIAHFLMQSPIARRGYSHAGLAQVTKDEASGISMVWARDLYPNADLGGIRFIGIEGFAHDGTYQRFGIAKYSPEKFLKWAREQETSRGYLQTIWKSRVLSDKFETPRAGSKEKSVEVKTNISREDYRSLVETPLNKSSEFMKEVGIRVIGQMDEFMTGREAMGFAHGQNIAGFGSCTEAIALAFLKSTNIDPQSRQDRWAYPVRIAKAMDLKDTKPVSALNDRVIAPGGFAWQTDLVQSHISVTFTNRTPTDRYLQRFQPERQEMSRQVSDALRPRLNSQTTPVNLDSTIRVAQDYLTWNVGSDGFGDSEKSKLAIVTDEAERKNKAPVGLHAENAHRREGFELPFQRSVDDEKAMREFLVDLGFKDYVAEMKKNLAGGKAYGPLSEGQLKRNIENYEVFNASRELSITIMERMKNRLGLSVDRRDLLDLIARMLALQKVNPARVYPNEINHLKEPERTKALENYLWEQRKDMMTQHTRKVVSDITQLIYGRDVLSKIAEGLANGDLEARRLQVEIARIHSLVAVNIESLYMDTQIGRTAFIGRALAALLARESIERKDSSLLTDLGAEVKKRGLNLQNYLGDNFVLYDEGKSKWVERKMSNMTFLLIKNQTAETAFISRGAIPHDFKLGKELGVVGNLAYALMVPSHGEPGEGISSLNRIKDRLVQMANWNVNNGYSHVGYARVLENRATGIRMTWVVDNYPEPAADASSRMSLDTSTGGVRILGYEHYDDSTHYTRFLAADHDKLKYFKFAAEYIRKNGYPKDGVAFPSIKGEFDKDGALIVPEKPTAQNWMMSISESEFRDLHHEIYHNEDRGKSNAELRVIAERWYDRVMQKTSDQLIDLAEKGMYFQWITPLGQYYYGGGYCSHTGVLATMMAAGVPLEEHPDRYIALEIHIARMAEHSPRLRKMLNKVMGEKTVNDFVAMKNLKPGIIAPSGLVAQKFHGEVTPFVHPNRKMDERAKSVTEPFVERDLETTRLLEKILPRTDRRFNQFASKQVLEVYKMTMAESDMEYAGATNAQKGVKVKGFDLQALLGKLGSEGKSKFGSDEPKRIAEEKPVKAEALRCVESLRRAN